MGLPVKYWINKGILKTVPIAPGRVSIEIKIQKDEKK